MLQSPKIPPGNQTDSQSEVEETGSGGAGAAYLLAGEGRGEEVDAVGAAPQRLLLRRQRLRAAPASAAPSTSMAPVSKLGAPRDPPPPRATRRRSRPQRFGREARARRAWRRGRRARSIPAAEARVGEGEVGWAAPAPLAGCAGGLWTGWVGAASASPRQPAGLNKRTRNQKESATRRYIDDGARGRSHRTDRKQSNHRAREAVRLLFGIDRSS